MTSAIGNKGMTAVSQASIMYDVSTKTKPGLTYVLFTLPQSRDIHPPCLLLSFVKIHCTVRDKIESSSPTYLLTTSFEYFSASRPVKASGGGVNTVFVARGICSAQRNKQSTQGVFAPREGARRAAGGKQFAIYARIYA